MSARPFAAAVASLLSLASLCTAARADVSVEACASAYARGQEDRLAGRLFSARTAFQACSASSCPAATASDCRHWVTEVEADLPTVRLKVSNAQGIAIAIANLRVSSDGAPIPVSALARPVILEAGPHVLRFEAAGYQPLELVSSLRPTDRELEVNAVLQPLGEPTAPAHAANARTAAPARAPLPTLAIGLAGAGLVALGTSLYFGLSAHYQYDEFKARCAPDCTRSQADSVHGKALIADVALLTSAAAFGAAAWLYLNGRPAQRPTAALNLEPRPDGARLRLRFTF